MPSLTINGHSVTVDDSFDKLSPEEQNATVDHIAKQLHEEAAPSGVVAGFAHGVSGVAGGDASTLGLGGVKSDTLDSISAHAEPKDYKAAHLIQNGHLNISALPQKLAEMAPGLGQDFAAGYTGSKVGGMFGPVGRAVGGLAGFGGSALLRTFGPGAHENADARTGVPNSPVETPDLAREGVKQAIQLPLNMVAGSRIVPGGSKLAGNALAKYITSATLGGAQAAGNDVVDQVGTTIGTKDGVKYDPTRTAEAAATGLAGGSALFAPRLAADVHGNAKYGRFETDPDTKAAAEALASRHLDIADGRKIDAKVGAEAVGGAHRDVHTELAAASKGEDLSQDNANTLKRINDGAKASPGEVAALADEASPETMHLARQALLSAQVKKLGDFSDDKFTGGISSKMEKTLRPIYNPTGTAAAVGAGLVGHAGGLGMLGTFAPQALAAIYGSYGAARILDKLTGARSPAQGFTDRFGGTDTPTRFEPPVQEQPLEDTGPTPQALKKEALSNIQVHEGMAKIAKQLADQKKKELLSDPLPLLKQLAISIKPVDEPAPESPNINPIALKMAQAKMKAGLPPEPAPAPPPTPEPPQAPVISPIALKMAQAKMKAGLPPEPAPAPPPAPEPPPAPVISPVALKMAQAKMKQGLPPEPAPQEPQAPPSPQFNPTALSMLQKKMKQGLPDPPASPQIAAAMQSVASHTAPAAPEAAPAAPASPGAPVASMADILSKLNGAAQMPPQAPVASLADHLRNIRNGTPNPGDQLLPPKPPVIAKITKKLNGNGKVEETPHPEAEQPYMPIPEEALYRKSMTDPEMVDHEFAKYSPSKKKAYGEKSVSTRDGNREDTLGATADHSAEDRGVAKALYHQLDHIHTPSEARKALAYYTSRMSYDAAAAVNAKFTPEVIAHRWKDKK
jgi:hypothetical protein